MAAIRASAPKQQSRDTAEKPFSPTHGPGKSQANHDKKCLSKSLRHTGLLVLWHSRYRGTHMASFSGCTQGSKGNVALT